MLDQGLVGQGMHMEGLAAPASVGQVVPEQGMVIHGGWYNDHAHLDKGWLVPAHGGYTDAPVPERAERTRRLKQAFTVADIRARAEVMLRQLIRSGTAYVRTHVDVDPLVGLRGVEALLTLQAHYADRIVMDVTAFAQEGFERYPETEALLGEALRMGVRGIGGHTLTDADGKGHIDRIFRLAERHGADWIEFHTDESGRPEHFLLPYLCEKAQAAGMGERVTAVHCNSLANVEEAIAQLAVEQVAETGLNVTVCPTAIATRALTRTKALLAAGVPVRLGSDNIGDYFNPLGSGNMLQYAQLLAYIQRFYEPKELAQLLAMLRLEPAVPGAQERIERLGLTCRYEAATVRDLLATAPLPATVALTSLALG